MTAPLRPNMEALVRNLERDTARSKRLMRQLLDDDPGLFLRSSIDILKTDVESSGARHMVGVLVGGGLLLRALCDPGISKEQALAIARAALRIDPGIDIALARTLADCALDGEGGPDIEQVARLMEILAMISDGSRIFPFVLRLLRHASPHIRSKAVLIIGRGNHSPRWVRERLADADPRIRANAAEALWGVETPEARELLQSLVQDSNNRVAGNAILGLYRLGDNSMIPKIAAMARHDSAMFRATAAWVMGETGDPRFTEILAGLLRETHAVVRKRAFAALGGIRTSVAVTRQGADARLCARLLDSENDRPVRRLLLAVAAAEGGFPPPLMPTQILLNEDDHGVWTYQVIQRPVPETMSIVFLLPRFGGDSARACLPWKRASDLWAPVYYSGQAAASLLRVSGAPRLTANPDAIVSDLERIPASAECGDLWHNLARSVDTDSAAIGARRRIIAFSEPGRKSGPSEELMAAVVASRALVQVISAGADPIMEEFCRRVNGRFWIADADTAIQGYLSLFARYEIVYQPLNPDARNLKIRIYAPGLCAETRLALTPANVTSSP